MLATFFVLKSNKFETKQLEKTIMNYFQKDTQDFNLFLRINIDHKIIK